MSQVFENLSEEKKSRILNAAFEVFGKYGYHKASINDIAKRAGISKASLFYYFENKESLYFYLHDFATLSIAARMQEGTEDLFECIRLSTRLKFEIFKKYPSMYGFLKSIVFEDDTVLSQLKLRNTETIAEANRLLFKNVDWNRLLISDFKEVMNLLSWVSEGCIKANAHLTSEEIVTEVNKYLNYLKKALYKEEFL